MADANEHLRTGDLAGARQALVDEVKRAPQDQAARMFLFQLLCVLGEWDKAKAQLRALAQLSPEAQMLAVTYNMAIDAELEREKAYAGEAPPALLVGSEWAGDLAAAFGFFAQGRLEEAEARRDQAFEAAPDTPGRLNEDAAFDFIADADPRFGPCFEAVVQGRWGLIPFDAVAELKTEGPVDLRDLVWLPVELAFRTGQSLNAMLPVRYPGTTQSDDAGLLLARATEWRSGPAGDEGRGQRLWSLGGEQDVGLLAVRRLTFA